MKVLVTNYSIVSSALTINAGFNFNLENILLVTDVDNNDILYNFADPSKGGTLVGKVLSLDYAGSTNVSTRLQIWIDDGKPPASDASVQALLAVAARLDSLMTLLQRSIFGLSLPDAAGRVRMTQDSGATFATTISSGTVTTVSGVTGFGISAFAGNDLMPAVMKLQVGNLRDNITH